MAPNKVAVGPALYRLAIVRPIGIRGAMTWPFPEKRSARQRVYRQAGRIEALLLVAIQ